MLLEAINKNENSKILHINIAVSVHNSYHTIRRLQQYNLRFMIINGSRYPGTILLDSISHEQQLADLPHTVCSVKTSFKRQRHISNQMT